MATVDWAAPVMPFFAATAAKLAAALYGPGVKGTLNIKAATLDPAKAALASVAASLDLRTALGLFALLKLAHDQVRRYPLIQAGFDRFYGPDFFLEMAQRAKEAAVTGPSLIARAAALSRPKVAADRSDWARARSPRSP